MTAPHVSGSKSAHDEMTREYYPHVVLCSCGAGCDLRDDLINRCWGEVESYPGTETKPAHYCQGHKWIFLGQLYRKPGEK